MKRSRKKFFREAKKSSRFLLLPLLPMAVVICFLGFLPGIFLSPEIAFTVEDSFQIRSLDRIFSVGEAKNTNTLWAVGNRGLILKSSDKGKTWIKVQTAWKNNLNDIIFFENQAWIVGGMGLILHSADGGVTWEKQNSNCKLTLMKMILLDGKKGFIVGGLGTILSTEDGGGSWKTYPLDWGKIIPDDLVEQGLSNINFYDIFFVDNDNGWIVGDYGTILKTQNGGATWEPQRIGLFKHLFAVLFKDQQNGWAAGINANFIHTSDGGRNWEEIKLPTKESLFKLLYSEKNYFLIGDKATVLQSVDGGTSWKRIDLALRLPYPWYIDGILLSNNPPIKLFVVGKGVLKEIGIP